MTKKIVTTYAKSLFQNLKNSKPAQEKRTIRSNTFLGKKKEIIFIPDVVILREELRIKSTEAYDKFCQNKKDQILKEDIKNLYKIDDYTTKEDLEIRTINLLENFKDNDAIFKLIDTFKKKAMEVVK